MSYPFDPNRLEATVIDLLALDRYTNADWLIQPRRSRASRTGCAGVPLPSRAPWTCC
jgi:hypothetical protein